MNIRHKFSRGDIVEIDGTEYGVTTVIANGEMAYVNGEAHTFEHPCVEFQSVTDPKDNFCIEQMDTLEQVAIDTND